MTILPDDINVVLMDFPKRRKTHEAVTQNADGTYTIFIDARISTEGQQREFNHAMQHIKNGDFDKHDVQLIEAAAHGRPLPKTEVRKMHRRSIEAALTRARRRSERAADALGMDYEDFIFAQHDADLFKGY